ncbi:hypothetical protein R75461_07998 [Paraburkholderia nemoris]|nr:hypothetical protein R75461_07998 [Paraburkholderia nemoris]
MGVGDRSKGRAPKLRIVGCGNHREPGKSVTVQIPLTARVATIRRIDDDRLGLAHLFERRLPVSSFGKQPGQDHGLTQGLRSERVSLPAPHGVERDMNLEAQAVCFAAGHGQQKDLVSSGTHCLRAISKSGCSCHSRSE